MQLSIMAFPNVTLYPNAEGVPNAGQLKFFFLFESPVHLVIVTTPFWLFLSKPFAFTAEKRHTAVTKLATLMKIFL